MCNGTDANMGVRACVDIINIFIYHCILYTMAHYLYIYIEKYTNMYHAFYFYIYHTVYIMFTFHSKYMMR